MRKAAIYARFSSDKQTEDSIEAQVRACREYAGSHGFSIVEIYSDEAVSGKGSKTAQRRQYVNLEARLKEKGVQLIATAQDFGNTNEAKIMRALMWSLSEYYIDNLASETRKGLRETALRAEHTGGVAPFGYDIVNG